MVGWNLERNVLSVVRSIGQKAVGQNIVEALAVSLHIGNENERKRPSQMKIRKNEKRCNRLTYSSTHKKRPIVND